MSEKYKFHDAEGMYFVTLTVVYWIDLFTRKEFKHIVIDSLKYCQKNKGLVIHAYCIMPSHIHLIISSNQEPLPAIMRDMKKHISKKVIDVMTNFINESRREWLLRAFIKAGEKLNRITKHKVWRDGNQPKQLLTNSFIIQKLDYIHNNPVEAEIVDEPEYYRYSSVRDYTGVKGLLDVSIVE